MNTNSRPNNITTLHRDRGYRWSDTHELSLLYQVRLAINNANLSTHKIWELVYDTSGTWLTPKTIDNLMNGKTKSPQLRTVSLIMGALGYRLEWTRK